MIYSVQQFHDLGSGAKNSLNFLRALAESLGQRIILNAGCTENAEKWVSWMLTYDSPNSGYDHLRAHFVADDRFAYVEDLKTLRAVVRRIARLEREACGYPLDSELKAA